MTTLQYVQDPATPSGLIATAGTGQSVNLTWASPASPSVTFEIERRGSGAFASLAQTAGVTTFNDATIQAGLTYSYRVRAVNAAGASSYSAVAQFRPAAGVGGKLSAPRQVKFKKTRVGSFKTVNVKVRNTHKSQSLSVIVTAPTGAEFSLDGALGASTIPPRGTLLVPVRFTPSAAGTMQGTLRLTCSDPTRSVFDIRLIGPGSIR